ncbi:hypothetical protein [Vibrio genomosp. F6]|uniref:Uncharacterized protein n=1 Tax=Vibrio genomosp. F6 str. FF-238 TaxID=1191298 RepID=A0A1E5D8N3_9VIBR|nr:hypothetical protein [Vibrio genomosp. F6]OEE80120.1 hypothetical protein A130_10370 [Vibrio genomosp. F6 str. FF-238]
MSISGIQSGYQMIQQSSAMAEDAARDINQINKTPSHVESEFQPKTETPPKQDLELQQDPIITQDDSLSFNKIEFMKEPEPSVPISYVDSTQQLTQAAGYNRIGANIVERNNEMIGSLLDIHI